MLTKSIARFTLISAATLSIALVAKPAFSNEKCLPSQLQDLVAGRLVSQEKLTAASAIYHKKLATAVSPNDYATLLDSAAAFLDECGIAYKQRSLVIGKKNYMAIEILPGERRLNRVAKSLGEKQQGTKLIYAPEYAVSMRGGASFFSAEEIGENVILLPTNSLLNPNSVDMAGSHEIFHSGMRAAKVAGNELSFQGAATAVSGTLPGASGKYNSFLSFEEMGAFRLNMSQETRKLSRLVNGTEAGAAESEKVLLTNIDQVLNMGRRSAERSLIMLGDFEKLKNTPGALSVQFVPSKAKFIDDSMMVDAEIVIRTQRSHYKISLPLPKGAKPGTVQSLSDIDLYRNWRWLETRIEELQAAGRDQMLVTVKSNQILAEYRAAANAGDIVKKKRLAKVLAGMNPRWTLPWENGYKPLTMEHLNKRYESLLLP